MMTPATSRRFLAPGIFSALSALGIVAPWASGEEPIDFNRDIRPILSQKCFTCHGPDEAERKGGPKGSGGLRLDSQEGAKMDLGGMAALVPGDPEKSELFYRVVTGDEDDLMPPPKHGKRLEKEEVALLERWIEEGGDYATHWSYQKAVRPEIPTLEVEGLTFHNAIDYFVAERLLQEGLKQSPEADRFALARRVALDLTGLPPSFEEAKAFVDDARPDAYGRYVDAQLAKPTFGEHWARMWLDLARYADSAGYADDPARTIWGYRDYVIRSLNENKPFDQFTLEQIAGDLLENPTEDQLVATAFHRNTQTNNEGGTNDEEYRNVAIVDRVNTTMAVWMGTTMACAQCHTHKYDPITQEEYFQMFAILNQTEDADRRNEEPIISLMSQAQREEMETLEKMVAELEKSLDQSTPEKLAGLKRWEEGLRAGGTRWSTLAPETMAATSGATFAKAEDGSVLVSGKSAQTDTYTVTTLPVAGGGKITGVRLEALPHGSLSEWGGPGRNGNFVLNEFEATLIPQGESAAKGRFVRIDLPGDGKMIHVAEVEAFSGSENVAPKGKASQSSTGFGGPPQLGIDGNTDGDFQKKSVTHTTESKDPWWEVDLGSEMDLTKVVVWNRTDNNLQSRLDGFKLSVLDAKRNVVWEKTFAKAPEREVASELSGARPLKFANPSSSFDQPDFGVAKAVDGDAGGHSGWAVGGNLGIAHEAVFEVLEPVDLPAGAKIQFVMKQTYADHAIGRFRISVTGDPKPYPVIRGDIAAILAKAEGARNADEKKALLGFYSQFDPARKAALAEIEERKKKLAATAKGSTTVPVMRELPEGKKRVTNLQYRGSFLDKGPEVTPGLPAALHPLPQGAEMDRLGLARWLVDGENPLTARVVANRYWEALFGVGIVATSEEFGSQGELPSHPELLDWLALELEESGWDLKQLAKTIVMSATYRQSSVVTGEEFDRDPQNRLLARGPRFRISAEMVRDQSLAVAGLLSPKMYGPPVKPPQPATGLKAAFGGGTDWQTSAGEDKHRRGLYTTWRRSSPYPSMSAFDAPNREVCTVRRDRTNTPLQALVTLNDPVYVEASQALARRMAAVDGSPEEKAAHGFRHCLIREPSPREVAVLTKNYAALKARYDADGARALQMATDPIGPLPEGADAADLAAWTVVANALLNLDEMFLKR